MVDLLTKLMMAVNGENQDVAVLLMAVEKRLSQLAKYEGRYFQNVPGIFVGIDKNLRAADWRNDEVGRRQFQRLAEKAALFNMDLKCYINDEPRKIVQFVISRENKLWQDALMHFNAITDCGVFRLRDELKAEIDGARVRLQMNYDPVRVSAIIATVAIGALVSYAGPTTKMRYSALQLMQNYFSASTEKRDSVNRSLNEVIVALDTNAPVLNVKMDTLPMDWSISSAEAKALEYCKMTTWEFGGTLKEVRDLRDKNAQSYFVLTAPKGTPLYVAVNQLRSCLGKTAFFETSFELFYDRIVVPLPAADKEVFAVLWTIYKEAFRVMHRSTEDQFLHERQRIMQKRSVKLRNQHAITLLQLLLGNLSHDDRLDGFSIDDSGRIVVPEADLKDITLIGRLMDSLADHCGQSVVDAGCAEALVGSLKAYFAYYGLSLRSVVEDGMCKAIVGGLGVYRMCDGAIDVTLVLELLWLAKHVKEFFRNLY